MNLRKSLLFLAGQFGLMGTVRFFFQWIVDFVHAPPAESEGPPLFPVALVGMVLLAFKVLDAVSDPVAGLAADRWVASGRKRHTLLYFTFMLPPIGLTLVFSPTHAMTPGLRWALLIFGMITFFFGYTAFAIPFWSLVEDYSQRDPKARSRLSTLLGLGTLIATTVAFVITPILVDAYGFAVAGMTMAALSLCLMPCAFRAAPDDMAGPEKRQRIPGSRDLIKTVLKDRRYMAVLCVFAGSQMAFSILGAAAPFIAVNLLKGARSDVALILGPLIGAAIPCLAWTPKLSRRFGWERCIVVASVALGFVYFTTAVLGLFAIGSFIGTAVVLFAFSGPLSAVLLGLEGEAIASCAEKNGGQAVSLYFGAYNFATKSLNGVAIAYTAGLVALSDKGWGDTAIRLAGPSGGFCLLAGVVLYILFKPKAGGIR